MPAYFDNNATTQIDPRVADTVVHYLTTEFGNAGSRTHQFGTRAAQAIERARDQVAEVLGLTTGRVVFTSGATESNNLAILGLEDFGRESGKKHLLTTAIEHKAVLEPLQRLEERGFELELIKPDIRGFVRYEDILSRVRPETLLVSVMHVNNETGILQPIQEIADGLSQTEALFHVDAAQGFGKETLSLRNPNVDFISISSHKIYGPKGTGALAINEKNKKTKKLIPLMVGGGQEQGLRPGTLPVALIAGLGHAAELALHEHSQRTKINQQLLEEVATAAKKAGGTVNGDINKNIGNVLNVSFLGVDSESAMLLLQDDVAISNGAACSSNSYTYSHVLEAMGLERDLIESALRISWYHESERMNWDEIFGTIAKLQSVS